MRSSHLKQVLQNLGTGSTEIIDTPCPQIKKGHVLIKTKLSLISTGTEKTAVNDSKTSVVKKIMNQPSKLKKAWDLYSQEGLDVTLNAIKKQFDFPITMGYSNVGVVIGVGPDIKNFKVGDRVLSNGPHAEVVNVPKNLCAKIPDSVSNEDASFTVLASIGLQGIRLINPTIGETVAVMGLGIIGLLSVQILIANGCNVIAIDPLQERVDLAKSFGATGVVLSKDDPLLKAQQLTNDLGVDAVLITAATDSNAPIEQSAQMCRKRGRIVLTGVIGLNINRNLFYEKELTFQVSCSYGPGRYDHSYEQLGNDYPIAFVRWTEQRNFETCLKLLKNKKIDCSPFVNNKFNVENIKDAYDQISSENPPLTVLIQYPENKKLLEKTVQLTTPSKKIDADKANIAVLGVGNYSQNMIIPTLNKCDAQITSLVSQNGLSSTLLGKKLNIAESTTDLASIFERNDINTVVIATRHNTHSDLICQAFEKDKHVFVEKPICIDEIGLKKIKQNYKPNKHFLVGYNRRFSPLVEKIQAELSGSDQPRFIQANINAGFIPTDHWTQDGKVGGGRLIGEACHFIDLARFLANSSITNVQAHAMTNTNVIDENISINLQFKNGSLAVINYYANGCKRFAKEHIQVSHAGSIYRINDFKSLNIYSEKNEQVIKLKKQDKGQLNMFQQFLTRIEQGDAPLIPIEEIFEVAEFTLKARKEL